MGCGQSKEGGAPATRESKANVDEQTYMLHGRKIGSHTWGFCIQIHIHLTYAGKAPGYGKMVFAHVLDAPGGQVFPQVVQG